MAKGYSLHIGVNETDSAHYGNALSPLVACEADAIEMAQLADRKGFAETLLLANHEATSSRIFFEIESLAKQATKGDLVFITFSGHGSQIPILKNAQNDVDDRLDETWCVFDTQLIDSEVYQRLALFEKGVRVLFLLDSCHSGTAIHEWIHESWGMLDNFTDGKNMRYRQMRDSARNSLYKKHKDEYSFRQEELLTKQSSKIKASVCLMAACQDNQRAIEDTFNGMFTRSILMELDKKHSYQSMHRSIHKHLHAFQSPNLYTLGIGINSFLKQSFLQI